MESSPVATPPERKQLAEVGGQNSGAGWLRPASPGVSAHLTTPPHHRRIGWQWAAPQSTNVSDLVLPTSTMNSRRLLSEGITGDETRSNKRKKKEKKETTRRKWEGNCPVKWLHSREEAAEPLMLRGRVEEECEAIQEGEKKILLS